MRRKELVLATDLDGTFLGGSEDERAALYAFIKANRDRMGLIFVTGRDVDFIRYITTSENVPAPDLIIGDVGTTIVSGIDYEPFAPVDSWIEDRWPGPSAAEAALADCDHLKKQEVFGGRRVSYFYCDETAARQIARDVEECGYDVLMSAGVFFDVLPRGIQKGPTLMKAIDALEIDPAKVLVAGDTLNDLSLFKTGLDGVAVGNSEPLLLQALSGLDTVYYPTGEGAAGVLDAIHRKFNARNAKETSSDRYEKI
ncbi:MAG: HAD hydrolase family protein [Rhizobiales bacterium]|nr:HAD hydrolase family protein [Hyphomicrobiales bacterium]